MEKKKIKKQLCTVDPEIRIKIWLHLTYLPFFSSNTKILKAFPKTFPTEMNLTRYQGKEKNEVRKAKEEERRERY